jgi:hypothetical protein
MIFLYLLVSYHAMATEKTYISSWTCKKQQQLDELIAKYAVYSSDTTYGDIIVPRDSVVYFINSLTNIGVAINSINWWCNATDENKNKFGCPHGYGGPMTRVGWFSEMCHDFDEISGMEQDLFLSLDIDFKAETIKSINDKTIELIKNKRTITYADGTFLTFQNNPCLTPGLDLYVPNDWKTKANDKSTNR